MVLCGDYKTRNKHESKNVRRHAQRFDDLLLQIGNGDVTESNGEIELPMELGNKVKSMEELILSVYPDIGNV